MARLAAESGLFPVIEAQNGEVVATTKIRNKQPVSEYCKLQKRFAHIFKKENNHMLEALQAIADRNIRKFNLIPEA